MAGELPEPHKMYSKSTSGKFIIKPALAGFVLLGLLAACENRSTENDLKESEKAKSVAQVVDFQKRTRASAEWFSDVDPEVKYTFEIQEALLSDDAPRLLIAELLDISKSGGKIIASFSEYSFLFEVIFRIELTQAQADEIIKKVPGEDRGIATFVLAFRPESVTRPLLMIDAKGNDEYAEVEIENSQATIITGTCIAWEYLGTSAISMPDFIENQSK